MAAPVGAQVFSEILPYLEVNKGNQEEVETVEQVETPDITGKSITEAQKILKESGLEMVIENEIEGLDKENTFIKEGVAYAKSVDVCGPETNQSAKNLSIYLSKWGAGDQARDCRGPGAKFAYGIR